MPAAPNQRAITVKTWTLQKSVSLVEKKSESKLKTFKIILETKTVTPKTVIHTAVSIIIITTTRTVTEPRESRKLFMHPLRRAEKQTTPQRNVILEPMQTIARLPRHVRPERQNQVPERANLNDSKEVPQAAAQNLNEKCHVFTPELRPTDRRQLI